MKRYQYIPFAGDLAALNGLELAGLKEVSQGWYVGYEEVVPPVAQIAEHFSAFANQSGGWLFIGVKGQDTGRMKAIGFPGVPANTVGEALGRVGVAASAHVTPEVDFETKTIEGPVPELGLAPGQSILVIGIPQGANPPYVHSSGRIYRRSADHSSPAPETDRRDLDGLSDRAREAQQRLAEFLSLRPPVAEHDKQGPVRVFVYLLEDPFLAGASLGLSYPKFFDVMRSSNENINDIAAGFDNLFTTSDGYFARQVIASEPLRETLSFRWWFNGNARISIPVDICDVNTFSLRSDPRRSDFVRLLRRKGLAQARIVDFSGFLALLAAVTGKYLELRQVLGLGRTFWGKVRFCEAWRAVPFINLRQYVDSIEACGFPVVQDNDFYAPPGLSTDDLIRLELAESGGVKGQSVLLALRLAVSALRAVGIDFDSFIKEDFQGFLRDLADSMNIVLEAAPVTGEEQDF